MASMGDTVYGYGLWLQSGQPHRHVGLVINNMQKMIEGTPWTLVSFGEKERAMSGDKAHGSAVFHLNGDKYEQCSISFHRSGSNNELLKSKTLVHQGSGIWTEGENSYESLVLLWVSPFHALHSQWLTSLREEEDLPGMLEGKNPGFSMADVKIVLRWFHPGKNMTPTRVLLRHDTKIHFVNAMNKVKEANGVWAYVMLPDDRELLTTWYHYAGKRDIMSNPACEPTIFEKIGTFSSTEREIQKTVPIAAGIKHFFF
jgi:hypothetical protein